MRVCYCVCVCVYLYVWVFKCDPFRLLRYANAVKTGCNDMENVKYIFMTIRLA